MAKQKQKAAKRGKSGDSKGVVSYIKRVVARKPKAKTTAPTKAKPAPAKANASAKSRTAKTKSAPAPTNPTAQNANAGQPVKRKPPSITITRPEVTRPPLVQMPTPKKEPPAGAPNILLPKGGLPVTSLTPSLRWMYVGGATRYEVEWSNESHFGRGHSVSIVSAQTLITLDAAHALKPGVTYQWRVRGGNDSGWGPWSIPESFKSPDNP